jgi:hypothetical protein
MVFSSDMERMAVVKMFRTLFFASCALVGVALIGCGSPTTKPSTTSTKTETSTQTKVETKTETK